MSHSTCHNRAACPGTPVPPPARLPGGPPAPTGEHAAGLIPHGQGLTGRDRILPTRCRLAANTEQPSYRQVAHTSVKRRCSPLVGERRPHRPGFAHSAPDRSTAAGRPTILETHLLPSLPTRRSGRHIPKTYSRNASPSALAWIFLRFSVSSAPLSRSLSRFRSASSSPDPAPAPPDTPT